MVGKRTVKAEAEKGELNHHVHSHGCFKRPSDKSIQHRMGGHS